MNYQDAHKLAKGLSVRWHDYAASETYRRDIADLRRQHPSDPLVHGHLIHPALADRLTLWATGRARRRVAGHVYLARCCGRVKIGKSVHPSVRVNQWNTPYPAELVAVIYSADMHGLESALHEKYAHARCYREWHELTDEEVAQAAAWAAAWRAE